MASHAVNEAAEAGAVAPTDTLIRGREAVRRRAWADAYQLLVAEDGERRLGLDDLELLVMTTHMVGRDDEGISLLTRGHQEARRAGDAARAARHAFWLALMFLDRGEGAQAGGWVARGQRLLEGQPDCVEHGYLLVPVGIRALAAGDFDDAHDTYATVAEIADRFMDPDLATLARLGRGEALLGRAETREGLALLDEAMVAVTAGDVSPGVAGIVYCSVIESCQRLFDLRRAQEWTAALSRWVESQPQLVAYRGRCLLHRAELMTLHGSWQGAVDEVRRARERLAGPPPDPAVGAAHYQEAELHRLRGDYAAAEDGYRQASRLGRRPEPGLGLLRLGQGRTPAATAAIDRAVDDAHDPGSRPALLDARVEIALAAGDGEPARLAADELASIARTSEAPILDAMAARAEGAVLLASGGARAALGPLRRSWDAYQELDAPYEAARVRVLIGQACVAMGDEDAARLEFEAAREVFERLGARPALRRLGALIGKGLLTAREAQVLRLLAAGRTNRAIASELVISEKTVARHVSNIFTKLGVGSRSAATAYAYEHDLVTSTG